MNFSNYQNLRDLFTAIGNKFTHRPETIEISQANYDQLTTEQKNDKTKEYFIYDADGGGDSVQWTQVLPTGTKIAEVNINGTTQGVFAPSGSGSEVTWNQVQQSGTKIAEVSINGVAQNVYAPAGGSGGGVSDVQVDGTSVVTGGVANITMPDIDDLSSVNITSLVNGQVLKYNSSTSKWENANESGGGASSLAALNDVTISSPTNNQLLKYNSTSSKWENSTQMMTILSYGNSVWNDFIAAYEANAVVYCRASSNSDPSSGSQTRLAFMAYVNNATTPTEVEFQYYRSVSSHSDNQQGDQVFVYKLTKTSGWTVTTRDSFTKIVAGTNMTSSYSNGTLTLNSTASGGTTVVANPSGTAGGGNLTKLQVGSTIYSIPSGGGNTDSSVEYEKLKKTKFPNVFMLESTTIEGLPVDHTSNGIWTDGINTYWSSGTNQYFYNKTSGTWATKTWNGNTIYANNFSGEWIWTDGNNIYLSVSGGNVDYVLDKATSTWTQVTFTFNGSQYHPTAGDIWTDGVNIYAGNLMFNPSDLSWSSVTWNYPEGDDPLPLNRADIWSDGINIYYSQGIYGSGFSYVLDKSTRSWVHKEWYFPATFVDQLFEGDQIWSDGTYVYFMNSSYTLVLDKDSDTWIDITVGRSLSVVYGKYFWTDGENIYYSLKNTGHYKFITNNDRLHLRTI